MCKVEPSGVLPVLVGQYGVYINWFKVHCTECTQNSHRNLQGTLNKWKAYVMLIKQKDKFFLFS